MRFADMTPALEKLTNRHRNLILQKLGLKEGETELKILAGLSKVTVGEAANVYELSKKLSDVGHYSTILRALRRLEQKKLVRGVLSIEGRREKVYFTTFLGDLIIALAHGGWKATAQILAESSSSFRECIKAHFFRNPYRYWSLTRDIIKILCMRVDVPPNIEGTVRHSEIDWIKEHIATYLNDPSCRPWISKYLTKMSHVSWIKSELIPFIDYHIEVEKEWLRTLADFKKDLLSAEKGVKLTQYFVDKHP